MKIDVAENRTIRLKDVFNSVLFETDEGEKLAVCMRDGGFEIGIKDQTAKGKEECYSWYTIMNGEIKAQICKNMNTGPCEGQCGRVEE